MLIYSSTVKNPFDYCNKGVSFLVTMFKITEKQEGGKGFFSESQT